MMDELFRIILRVLTILPLLLIVTMYMGKRAIGQLPLFDFLIIITLASVTGADIADPDIEHLHTIVAILVIALLQRIVSYFIIKKRWFGHFMTFEPTVVVENGVLILKNIEQIRYSIDNILQMLREKDIFDLSTVKLGIVEANGKLTVYRNPENSLVTLEDIYTAKRSSNLAYPVMMEGKVYTNILKGLGLNTAWLHNELKKKGISRPEEVVFASVNEDKELHVSLKNADLKGPPLQH